MKTVKSTKLYTDYKQQNRKAKRKIPKECYVNVQWFFFGLILMSCLCLVVLIGFGVVVYFGGL